MDIEIPEGAVDSLEAAQEILENIGNFPVVVRPVFSIEGQGGGLAEHQWGFNELVEECLELSWTGHVLVDPFPAEADG